MCCLQKVQKIRMPGYPFPGNLSAHQTAGLTLGADRSRGNSLAAGIELQCCLGVAVVGLNVSQRGSPVILAAWRTRPRFRSAAMAEGRAGFLRLFGTA